MQELVTTKGQTNKNPLLTFMFLHQCQFFLNFFFLNILNVNHFLKVLILQLSFVQEAVFGLVNI